MTMTLRTASLLLALVIALVAGCQSKDDSYAGLGLGGSREGGDIFQQEPNVTADTYFAAGQFHETSTSSTAGRGQPRGAVEAQRQARLQRGKAVEQYEKAITLDPQHAPSLFRLAVIHTEEGEFDEAIALWERYVHATDGAAAAWVNLAICQEAGDEPKDAEASYRHAISVDPAHETARVNLGMLLARDGRLQEAASQLANVLEPAGVHWHLAHALARRGDQTAADRHFRAAASLDARYQRAEPTPQASVR